MMRWMLRCMLASAVVLSITVPADAENPLFEELRTRGVVADDGARFPLPAPTFRDGMTPAEQQAALAEIVGDRYPVAEFVRDSVVAPFVLKFRDIPQADDVARCVYLWFVVRGRLDDVASAAVYEKFSTARGGDATFHELTAAELQARGLKPADGAGVDERFVHSTVTVLDRVELRQTSQTMMTRTADSVLIASQVDRRFAADAEFPNAFRPLARSDSGEITRGPPQLYTGAGGYLLATRLAEPKGAILVEYHLVYLEPHDWFNGANLLRSKLPVFVQSRIRQLRREMRE